ncbi:hypothetical protein INS49_001473 [Diaporthe citri]|uniref:uncharacterized protein n=1 Tax=Diaporthe citri TaxID=83186 RepID=UPI001C7FB949|nr:uncharacterized protein INS49_001473 [Diaporthe citri]KAG6367286.1 hypothetical protein INS49_001473 [Diaporthe citri]
MVPSKADVPGDPNGSALSGLRAQTPKSSLHGPLRVLALAPLICGLPFAPAFRVSAVPGIQRSPTPNCG